MGRWEAGGEVAEGMCPQPGHLQEFRDGKAQLPLNTRGRLKTGRQNTSSCKEQADPQTSFSLGDYGRWLGRNSTKEALNSGHLTQSRGGAGMALDREESSHSL